MNLEERALRVARLLVGLLLLSSLSSQAQEGPLGPVSDHAVYCIENLNVASPGFVVEGRTGIGGDVTSVPGSFYVGGDGTYSSVPDVTAGGTTTFDGGQTSFGIRSAGNVTLNGFTTESGAVESGGSLSGSSSTIEGDALVAGTISSGIAVLGEKLAGTSFSSNRCVSHLALGHGLKVASAAYATMTDTGTPTVTTNGSGETEITLSGASGTNVFSLDAATLNDAVSTTLNGPDDAVFIVNVSGETLALGGATVLGADIEAGRVLWNFWDATSLNFQAGSGVWDGTVLAPLAAAALEPGRVINGALYPRALNAAGAVAGTKFAGPSPPGVGLGQGPGLWLDAVWVGGNTIAKLDRITLEDLPLNNVGVSGSEREIAADGEGTLVWTLRRSRLIIRWMNGDHWFTDIPPGNSDPVCASDDLDIDFPHLGLALDSPTRGWVGVCRSLTRYDGFQWNIIERRNLANPVRAVEMDRARNLLWVATTRTVEAFNPQGTRVRNIDVGIADTVRHLVMAESGDIFVGFGDRVSKYNSAGTLIWQRAIAGVDRLAVDRKGRLWVAADESVYRLNRNGAILFDVAPFPALETIRGLAADPADGTALVASDSRLIRLGLDGEPIGEKPLSGFSRGLYVYRDIKPPTLQILSPTNGAFTNDNTPTFVLSANDTESGLRTRCFETAGEYLPMAGGTPASPLADGDYTVGVSVVDWADNTTGPKFVSFTVDTVPPDQPNIAKILVRNDGSGTIRVTGEAGSVEGGSEVKITNKRTGESVTVMANADGSFDAQLAGQEGDEFEITATDKAGNTSEAATTTVRAPLPPDPVDVAPEPDTTTAGGFHKDVEFLYTGPNPIQRNADPDAITPVRVAVLRGQVFRDLGVPLPGVQVTILSHPEYGETFTRDDGRFDMAVSGGGPLTVRYDLPNYLDAQRTIEVPWRDFVAVPDVVLLPLDSRQTPVEFGSGGMQVARGNPQKDHPSDPESRQATILFPSQTNATIVGPNGETSNPSTLTVRATEFTVGEKGPAAMPGELPPTSGYTYAVELSVNEAGDDDTIVFDRPLPFYVENFLGFPAGTKVPTGYYDRQTAQWIASKDGRVISIVGQVDNKALIDITDDGQETTEDTAELAAIGVTEEERMELASLYASGQSLWRVSIEHFTPWDCNFPYSPPPNAQRPKGKPEKEDDEEDPDCSTGSIIECQNQILGETIPIAGTPFSLNYRSDRVPGRKVSNTVTIPLTPPAAEIPADADTPKWIEVEIFVAGQEIRETHPWNPAESSQSSTFTWDGKDVYGRTVQGARPVTVRVGYVYDGVYQEPADFEASFAQFSGVPMTFTSRSRVKLWMEWKGEVGRWDNSGLKLGGWSLDAHHSHDPEDQVLYLGDGSRRSANALGVQLKRFAGNGGVGSEGDGGPALEAELYVPGDIAVAPDGSVYFADTGNDSVRRIGTDGIISLIAGGGESWPDTGDGGPATQAVLGRPEGVAVASDGSVYIADEGAARVRRVDPQGIITTVAGNGTQGFSGDGGPATEAQLSLPLGIAVSSDASLYIADESRVRRVGPDGIITTVAGNGTFGPFEGDGQRATDTAIGVFDVEIGSDGSLYLAEGFFGSRRIRRVGQDGIITTVAGNGQSGDSGDGGPAVDATMQSPRRLAFGPDGSLYVADQWSHRVRRIDQDGIIATVAGIGASDVEGEGGLATAAGLTNPAGLAIAADGTIYIGDEWSRVMTVRPYLPDFDSDDFAIPSADGSLLYRFDETGKHQATVNALTGATIYDFAYDLDSGLLVSITDGDGNETVIERDGDGGVTAIVALPFGHRTTLSVDTDGYLVSLQDPASGTWSFGYDTGGLLSSLTNPRNKTFTFAYDAAGRLETDLDPAGGSQTLARSGTAANYTVTRTTGLGRTITHLIEKLPTGDRRSLNTFPDETQQETLAGIDGVTSVTAPDGTIEVLTSAPDPRFGLQAEYASSQTVTTPGGLMTTIETIRDADLADPYDLMSVVSTSEIVTVNGRPFTTDYDAATRTYTLVTPASRQAISKVDLQGRLTESQIVGLEPTSITRDPKGRLSTLSVGDGLPGAADEPRNFSFAYEAGSGFLDTVTDPLNRVTSFDYDPTGRVTRQVLPGGAQINFSWDANGNLASVTPPGRPVHTFDFTAVDLPGKYTAPLLPLVPRETVWEYDIDRDLRKITRPDGKVVEFIYDPTTGQLTSQVSPRGTTSFGYDTSGRLSGITTPEDEALTFTYDGSLLTGETSTGTVAGSVTRTFDDDFRISTESVNGGNTATFTYDDDGLLTRAGDLAITRHAQTGLVTGTTLGAVTDTWTYNPFGEPETYTASVDTGGGPVPVYEVVYGRDKLGRITAKEEVIDGVTSLFGYGYDLPGRLWTVERNGFLESTYIYDGGSAGNGNRTTHNGPAGSSTGVYDEQDRLMSYTTPTGLNLYEYNANGDLSKKTLSPLNASLYTYDALGNLISVTLPNGTQITYVIDGRNRRIGKKVGNVWERKFLYRDQLNPVAELDESNNVISRFVYGTKPNVPDYMVQGGVTYRIISDHLGSPRLVINTTSGAIAQRIEYDEFGNVTNDTNPGFQPFGFAGGIYDQHTKLVRFGARDYDPEVGRWVAKDPILFAGLDSNLYGYVFNDPINWIDPPGLAKFPPDPSQVPPNWTPDPTHRDPNGQRFRDPNGRPYDFHRGRPGRPGWGGRDHWHCPPDKRHYRPGDEIPGSDAEPGPDSSEQPKFSLPDLPWWLPLLPFLTPIPDPY